MNRVLAADLKGLGAKVEVTIDRNAEPIPPKAGAGLLCGLLGRRLGHTLSPEIHARLGAYAYKRFECEPERLDEFLRTTPFDGLNVTIPYKEAVLPYCDELTPAAQHVGAVNTLVHRPDGKLVGDNTDYAGFLDTVRASGIKVKGKKALILGTGGAAKCVQAVLKDLGAFAVMVNIRGAEGREALNRHADAEILVNATPVGMFPVCGVSPIGDLGLLPKLSFVFDLIYNPAVTELMLRARARGIPAVNGLRMLVVQAEAAARDFLSIASPSTARRPNRQRALKKFMRTSSVSSKTSCFQACRGAANPPSAAFLRHGLDAPSSIWMKKSRLLRNSPSPKYSAVTANPLSATWNRASPPLPEHGAAW